MIKIQLLREWRSDPGILLGRIHADLESVLRLGVAGAEDFRWERMLLGRQGNVMLISSRTRCGMKLIAILNRSEVESGGDGGHIVELFGKKARMVRLGQGTTVLRKIEENQPKP